MKFGRFLKIGAPVLGLAALGSTTTVVATSCSSSDSTPANIVAATTLNNQLELWFHAFDANKQALIKFTDFTNQPSFNEDVIKNIQESVKTFNKNNADNFKNYNADLNGLQLFFVWTSEVNGSNKMYKLTFYLGTNPVDSNSAISLVGADGKELHTNFHVTIAQTASTTTDTPTPTPTVSVAWFPENKK